MTDEIINLMNERRLLKGAKTDYRNLQRIIQQKIRWAKQEWIERQCAEIEELEKKYDTFNIHKKIRETTGMNNFNISGKIQDSKGNIIVDRLGKTKIWKAYINQLFEDPNRPENPPTYQTTNFLPITVDEVTRTIIGLKNGKAPGPDNIRNEFLKLLKEEDIRWLTNIFNEIYFTGIIPDVWLKSTFITLPKKSSAKNCEDFRTISLMSQSLKLFLKLIHQRIYKICEEQISCTQFGFRNALGTREALFSIQVLFQRARDVNHDIFACFIDYQKAFDKVQHDKMMEILESIGLEKQDLRIIANLYWNQTSSVRIESEESDEVLIKRGVRQGCVLSPLLFNIYSEQIFREALENTSDGVIVNGECINNIRYADDTVIISNDLEGLQRLMNRVVEVSERYGLRMNTKKTKFMIISKNRRMEGQLLIHNRPIQRVNKYVYLGTNINEEWDHSVEIRCRIEKARAIFLKMGKLFKSRDLPLNTKMRILRCYVFSTLLYGVESWTLSESSCKKLEAFELWLYRRVLRISWVDHVTNEEVLRRMRKEKEILYQVKKRKLEYLGHIMRNPERYRLLQLILQGKIQGRRSVGRRRISWLKNLRVWFNTTTVGLFRASVNKVRIAIMLANIRNG